MKNTQYLQIDGYWYDASSYCDVSTGFITTAVNNTYYVFSITDLRTYFELPVGTFYYRVRSDNDTDTDYSTISAERSIALPNQTPWSDEQTDWICVTNICTGRYIYTTTTVAPATTEAAAVEEEVVEETTTTTTTTTLPPPPPPPPTTIPPEEVICRCKS